MSDEAKAKAQEIADAVKTATVAIVLHHPDIPEKKNRPFTILGSGFCIHSKGVIVTCKHVLDGFIDPDNRQPHVIFYHPKIPGRPSRLPSFSDRTEHLVEDWLCCQHLDELFDQGL